MALGSRTGSAILEIFTYLTKCQQIGVLVVSLNRFLTCCLVNATPEGKFPSEGDLIELILVCELIMLSDRYSSENHSQLSQKCRVTYDDAMNNHSQQLIKI